VSAPAVPSPGLERVTRSHVQEWAAPPERVLPLLTAAREGEWAAAFTPRTYTYSALSEAGNARVAEVTEERYRQQMVEWERALNHFLRTGERLGNY
jgi:hypothetical protein